MSAARINLDAVGIEVRLTDHALWRAAERFGIGLGEQLVAEVKDAFYCGRFSREKPPGVLYPDDPHSLYAWTPSGRRVLVVRADWHRGTPVFVLVTVIAAEVAA